MEILARQVTVTEMEGGGAPCSAQATDPLDGIQWTCTLHPGHEGPHVAHYEHDDNPDLLIAGLIWGDDPCVAATEHLSGTSHRWQECPTYHQED